MAAEDSEFVPVFFDLETTGLLATKHEIIQIGAINDQNDEFCRFIIPTKEINDEASRINNFTKVDDQLLYRGEVKETTSLETALYDFIEYLHLQEKPVVLVGHNCLKFDCQFLLRDYKSLKLLDELRSVVLGFTDSLHLFRGCMPNKRSYRQDTLVKQILGARGKKLVGHEALVDATALLNMFQKKNFIPRISSFYRSFDSVVRMIR